MERKEQTGHICRWMALGIMTAIIIVGCTIVIGLFEWRDRKEIECRNAELHQWRKNVHDLNLHITELSLLGEMVADWDSTDVNVFMHFPSFAFIECRMHKMEEFLLKTFRMTENIPLNPE